jgi:glycosyltransferase involved in cell wall biosynthesis
VRVGHFLLGRSNPDSANGVDKTVYYVSEMQAKLGHDVAIFSVTPLPPIAVPRVDVRAYQPRRLPVVGNRDLNRGRPRAPLPLPAGLMSDLLDWSPDIVHFHSVHVPEAIVVASRLNRRGTPYCVSPHGGLSLPRRGKRMRKMVFSALFERSYLNRAAFLHAVSRSDLEGARRHGVRVRIVLAPNCIDPAVMPAALDPDLVGRRYPRFRSRRVLLFLGRIDPEVKGLDLLLRAWSRTSAPDTLALLVVGPDWRGGRTRLQTLAEQLDLADSVAFHGRTSGTEKWSLLSSAEVFVLPSRRDAAPFSVLEAMLAAKPVLLSAAADPAGLVRLSGAGLVVPGNLEGLQAGLEAISGLSDERLVEMGLIARQLVVREFRWENTARTLLKAYEKALAPPPGLRGS